MKTEEGNTLVVIDEIEYLEHSVFIAYENDLIGSIMRIEFHNFFEIRNERFDPVPHISTVTLVRGLPVKDELEHYFAVKYLNIILDFQSPKSDQLLTISRDKFIKKSRRKYNNMFFETLLPKISSMCVRLFENKHQLNVRESVAIEYFHIEMTSIMSNNGLHLNSLPSIYNEFTFPASIITNKTKETIMLKDFFKINKVLTISWSNTDNVNPDTRSSVEAYDDLNADEKQFDVDAVIWLENYFYPYLNLRHFNRTHYHLIRRDRGYMVITVMEMSGLISPISYNAEAKKSFLVTLLNGVDSVRRNTVDAIIEYSKSLAVNVSYDEFRIDLDRTSCYIVSPFSQNSTFLRFKEIIKDSTQYSDVNDLRNLIVDQYLDKLVTDSLLEFVSINSLFESNRTKETVRQSYLDLIVESVVAYREYLANN